MGLDTSYDNISEVLSLLQRYKQKIIVHNGDNYINKFYNMIYLDVNNKVNIKKNKVYIVHFAVRGLIHNGIISTMGFT